jgi:hypothetical protein
MKQHKGHAGNNPGSHAGFIAFPDVTKKKKIAKVAPQPISSQSLQFSISCYLFEKL